MPTDLDAVAVAAMRLQNGYALAVDTRDWDHFRTLLTADVVATYPHTTYHGVEEWTVAFAALHERYPWSLHVMSNHAVGEDRDGVWASCYGWVQWTDEDRPDTFHRTATLYRDRLERDVRGWRIARRTLAVLLQTPESPFPAGWALPASVAALHDRAPGPLAHDDDPGGR